MSNCPDGYCSKEKSVKQVDNQELSSNCPSQRLYSSSPAHWKIPDILHVPLRTMPRSTRSVPLSQSTSDQRRPRHSEIRRPKQMHTKAIVRCGSCSSALSFRNSSTVRLRGCFLRLDAPLTVTKPMGLTCVGMACVHIAKFQSELRIPRM
jgi:hypothetical protein